MSNQKNQTAHLAKSLVILGLVLSVLVACGGPAATPQVVVVTSTFTPQPVVQVVTATFTPPPPPSNTPLSLPSDTPLPPPSDTPPPAPTATLQEVPLEYVAYDHPSGAFSLDIPQDAEYTEDATGLYLTYGDSLLMVFFSNPDSPLDAAGLEAAVPAVLDQALVGEGLISSYSDLTTQGNEAGDQIGAAFKIVSDLFGNDQGNLVMWQVGPTLYFMILLTPDYASVRQIWQTAFNTLTATPVEPSPVPVPPTNTPRPPTPTTKPKPKATATPKPPAPPPTTNQGCYLFENQLGAELTVTFTAQDRQWNDSFKIAANGTKEYCLDPGRYTYTIDAPPPWNSINGELQVNPGDRYRWPIKGG
jgi:hypothetical protein